MAVTPENIAVALGVAAPDPASVTFQQWQMWIDDAAMLIETRRLDLGVDPIDEAKVDYVTREAVVAHVQHPDNATQVTVSVDDGSTSRSYRSGKGRVTIIDEWWTLLGLTEPSGAFSVDMVGTSGIHQYWCSLLFGAALFCTCGAIPGGIVDGNTI